MYTVKTFVPALETSPNNRRFKSLANAKAYAKQIVSACEKMKLNYELSIFTNEKTYVDEKVEF